MTIIPQCVFCEHFINNKTFSCKAFNYIPDNIITNKVIHENVLSYQKGTAVFKRAKD